MAEYKLSYTGTEINEKLGKVDTLKEDITAHKNDITRHIREEERTTWNNAISQLSEEIVDQDGRIKALEDNPSGATEEQLQQIETNKNDIATLEEKLADEKTAREHAIAELNAILGQQTFNIAIGDTQDEAESWLETNGDKTQVYLMPDDTFWQYKKTTEVIEGGASYTNQIPLSTDTDRKTIYNTTGYKRGVRLSGSSGAEASSSANTNYGICGFMKAKPGDTLCVTNFEGVSAVAGYVIGYDDNNTPTGNYQNVSWMNTTTEYPAYAEQVLEQSKLGNFTAIRLCLNGLDGDTIATINEEIKEGGGTTTVVVEKWTSTGHGLIATNYDAVIANMQSILTAHTEEIQSLKKSGVSSKVTMFISPDGNDDNNGLTKDTPKKTVKACVNAGATRVSAKRGVYNEIINLTNVEELEIFPTDNDLTYAVGTDRQPIVFEVADYITPSSLATYNSIKRVAYSNSANTQFDKVFTKKSQTPLYGGDYGSRYNATVWLLSEDEKTVCIKLKPVLTVAECEAEANTFAYVDSYIYINANMTGVDKIAVPTNWGDAFCINGAGKIVLREVEVRFGGCYNLNIKNCAYFDFYKCACKYTSYGSGFHPFNSNGVLTRCYATKNYDGYGVSGYGDTTYIDCVSEFNFDDGVSHHDGTKGTFIGGRYEGNGKGGNTPAYGAEVNIYGGIYKDNASFGIGYLYTSTHNPAKGIVQGAVMVGNTVGMKIDANCPVTMLSCMFKDNDTERTVNGNAILTEYGTVRG